MTLSWAAIESAIVRIYNQADRQADRAEPKGTGFRVGRRTVVTCSHVVNSALGKDKNSRVRPEGKVWIDFPFLDFHKNQGAEAISATEFAIEEQSHRPLRTYLAEIVGWYPVQDENRAGFSDIAVLQLPSDVPLYTANVPLLSEKPNDRQVRICGFAKPEGRWAQGRTAGSVATGLMQLDNLDHLIKEGDSGAPIWDEQSGYVVGMMVSVHQSSRQHLYAHILPSDTLLRAIQALGLSEGIVPTPEQKVSQQQLRQLFDLFGDRYWFDVGKAFVSAFEDSFKRSYTEVYKTIPSSFNIMRETLCRLNDPKLVASFVERARVRIQREDKSSDLPEQIVRWRDRFLTQHNLTLTDIQPKEDSEQPGYLLVSLEPHTKVDRKGAYVNVFAEVQRAGKRPIPIASETCALSEMGAYLHKAIAQAKAAIADSVTLEIFMPRVHLEYEIASWKPSETNDKAAEEAARLLRRQPYIIRSFERAKKVEYQKQVKKKWNEILTCIEKGNGCQRFHPQAETFDRDDLYDDIDEAAGLFLSAELSADSAERQGVLSDIVEAAIPFALWFSSAQESTPEQRQAAFNSLLQTEYMSDFATLSKKWRRYRRKHKEKPERHLKLLCDCPDRWPSLPNQDEDDALVAV